jgi:glycosyltransferase involved in cell wall biosynthesis
LKVLVLTNRIPWPTKDGGALAMLGMLKTLRRQVEGLHLLSINASRQWVNPNKLPPFFDELDSLTAVDVDTQVKPLGAFLNLFGNKSYNISRFVNSKVTKALKDLLEKEDFDVVQFDNLFVTPYLSTVRKYSNAKVVYRSHNIEFEIWDKLAQGAGNKVKKEYLKLLANRLKTYELGRLNKFDLVVPISEGDAEIYKKLGEKSLIFTSGFGIDMPQYPQVKLGDKKISFLGSLDWLPNQEGLSWFIEKVWPLVLKGNKNLILEVAGKNPPESIKTIKAKNYILKGEVDSALEFLKNSAVMVVPLISGSGIRIKIIEGLAWGLPMVSTSKGAEALGLTHGENILIADDPKEFAKHILELTSNKGRREQLSDKARAMAQSNFDLNTQGEQLVERYKKMMNA